MTSLKQRALAPDRIADLLTSLIERQTAKSQSADDRLLALQKELSDCEDRAIGVRPVLLLKIRVK